MMSQCELHRTSARNVVTLFADQICGCCTEWPNGIKQVLQTVRITHITELVREPRRVVF